MGLCKDFPRWWLVSEVLDCPLPTNPLEVRAGSALLKNQAGMEGTQDQALQKAHLQSRNPGENCVGGWGCGRWLPRKRVQVAQAYPNCTVCLAMVRLKSYGSVLFPGCLFRFLPYLLGPKASPSQETLAIPSLRPSPKPTLRNPRARSQ